MRKTVLLLARFLLFLSASLLTHTPTGFAGKALEQDQPERPKFYALSVVCDKKVQHTKDSLGAPDGCFAEILPGGQLVVLMEKPFIDSGKVVCKGEADYGLEGFFHIQDTENERQDYAWIIINRDPLMANRFLFFPGTYIWFSGTGVDKIRISNAGNKSLFVDAIIGYGGDVLTTGSRLEHTHTKTSLKFFPASWEK